MARIRSIKPEFWTSEQIAECSPNVRLLFIGMWNFCDDYGVHPASEMRLKMEVFPSDSFSKDDIRRMINELLANGLLTEYEVDGTLYWWVTGWDKHQKPDCKTGLYPRPDGSLGAKIRRKIAEGSPNEQRTSDERSRKEKEKEKEKETPDGFDEFWSAYPKKVGKGAAQAAWKKHKPDLATCIAAITTAKASRDWQKENGQYIPHPATWLNQMRWEDGETVAASPAEFDMQAFLRSKGL